MIIEIDGGIHQNKEIKENDIERQKYLEDEGVRFLRITNTEIEMQLEEVKRRIEDFIDNRRTG